MESFYDPEEDVFKFGPNTYKAPLLGEDVDNPLENFHNVISVCDERINILSKVLFNLKKKGGSNKEDLVNLTNSIVDNFDNIENGLYFRIKNLFSDFEKKNEELNAQNLLLQKHLTKLTKEKMDLLIEINKLMQKLDKIEQFLGINIEGKRTKKGMSKK
ncbi:MAG: hypothetical protein MJ252_18430 [archaeon]|nr:hypothetical protein [archaeon]